MILFFKKFCRCFSNKKLKSVDQLKEPLINDSKRASDPIVLTINEDSGQTVSRKVSESNLEKVEEVVLPLVPEKYLRDEEKGKIIFTQKGILDLIEQIRSETTCGEWINICNKDGLVIDYKNGSLLSNKYLLGKICYPLSKSHFSKPLTYEFMKKYMYDPEIRKGYDRTIKEYKILEIGENYHIFYILLHSPIFFIAERDLVDKRIDFVQDNVYYNLSTSVENFHPFDKNAVRIVTYLNLLILSQDEDFYYFESYTQYDAKTILPEKLLNFTIPARTMDWFTNFTAVVKKALESEDSVI